MTSRALTNPQIDAINADVLGFAWFAHLDIAGDPLTCWTGIIPVTFSGSDDARLNGLTFEGFGNIGEISKIQDSENGSDSVDLTLPGVDLMDPLLRQVVFNQATWQMRQGFLWFCPVDTNGNLIGFPRRAKTGRMDKMAVKTAVDGTDTVGVTLESHQSYMQQAGFQRYSEQLEIDNTDISQSFVAALANTQPVIGPTDAAGNQNTNPPQGFMQNLINRVNIQAGNKIGLG